MIHDFATAPRTPKVPASLQSAPRHPVQKTNRRLFLVIFLIIGFSVMLWQGSSSSIVSETTAAPTEAARTEYLEAASTEQALLAGPDQIGTATEDQVEPVRLQQHQQEKFQQELVLHQSDEEDTFGFYDSLQGSDWSVPVQRGVYLTEEDRKRASYRYILQAASLRSHEEALTLVAKLRKLGMNATYSVTGAGTGRWYRVNVGPFDNVSVMNKAEDKLVSMRMMPLKRRVK